MNPVYWVEPNEMQRGLADVQEGDIIANLPYHKDCSLWFDHHFTNQIDTPFEGKFEIAPSAGWHYFLGIIRIGLNGIIPS